MRGQPTFICGINMTRNFYLADHAPYYIFALDYAPQSAGVRALHYLCHALNESGLEAYVTCEGVVPHLRTPVLVEAVLMRHQASGRVPIMVYPEIVSGDPLAAGGVVVRWLLNKPGRIGGDTSFQESDLIFTYDQDYLPAGWHKEMLHIPTCDLSIFNNDDNVNDDARKYVCFYAHKYLYSGGKLTRHVKDAISLCKDQSLTRAEIATILRSSKVLYVYEQTALIAEALLCGCPVSVIDTDYWRNDASPYVTDWGVVYFDDSPESLVLAKAHVHNYRTIHEGFLQEAWNQIDRFVELTQNVAGMRLASVKSI